MPGVRVLMGQAGAVPATGAAIWQFYEGGDDAGPLYDIVAESVWVPAHPGYTDYIFYAVFVTVTWTMAVTLRVSAQIDSDAATETINGWDFAKLGPELVLAPTGTRRTETYEFPLMTKMSRGGSEVARNGLRGRRARIRIESFGGVGAGALIIDGVGIDREPLNEPIGQQGP
jgi:hypothetical protein